MSVNRKKTVLVIDDSEFMRSLIKSAVTGNGFRVVGEAANGAVGLEKYKILKPDIVTLDVNMDEMGGEQALERIMEYDPNANVVIISAIIGQEPFYETVRVKGAKAVVIKPIDEAQLIGIFKKILGV